MLDTIALDLDVHGISATANGDELSVAFSDGHESTFSATWLVANRYDPPRAIPSKHTLWRAGFQPPDIDHAAVATDDRALAAWIRDLITYGVTMVRNAPTELGTVGSLAERVAFIRTSNFGPIWDVVSKPSADSLAYTAHVLSPHNDLVSREMMPGVQFLHCLVFEATGGDSVLVDGFACAEHLRTTDPDAFHLLTTIPCDYRYTSPTTDVRFSSPMIKLDQHGQFHEIRYSNALLAPLQAPGDQMLPLYRAIRAFTTLLRSPEFHIQFRLQPGDMMVFDNYRVLHGRTEFDPQSGPRHLRGTYLDRDDLHSCLRILERQDT